MQCIQNGRAAPVMLHIAPTNRCNMNCGHCCFSGRDKDLELTFGEIASLFLVCKEIGIKSIEYTGGGEPTMYPKLQAAIDLASAYGFAQGINTNAIDIGGGISWSSFTWVRVSLNIIENASMENRIREHALSLSYATDVTACLVVPWSMSPEVVMRAVRFADDLGIRTRLVPDCIQESEGIVRLIEKIKRMVPKSEYAFVSDFNVSIEHPRRCMMHTWKPFAYADGWIYRCPSSELAPENGRTMNEHFRVCRINDMREYYKRPLVTFDAPCSYCKYTMQNEMLTDLLTETMHNDFA